MLKWVESKPNVEFQPGRFLLTYHMGVCVWLSIRIGSDLAFCPDVHVFVARPACCAGVAHGRRFWLMGGRLESVGLSGISLPS